MEGSTRFWLRNRTIFQSLRSWHTEYVLLFTELSVESVQSPTILYCLRTYSTTVRRLLVMATCCSKAGSRQEPHGINISSLFQWLETFYLVPPFPVSISGVHRHAAFFSISYIKPFLLPVTLQSVPWRSPSVYVCLRAFEQPTCVGRFIMRRSQQGQNDPDIGDTS